MSEKIEQPIDPTDTISQSEKVEAAFAEKAVEHLANWDENAHSIKSVPKSQFMDEELLLFNLEKLRSLFTRPISPSERIGDQLATCGSDTEKLETWGELIGYIERAIGQSSQFNILVTGLPISGKATLRRAVANSLRSMHPNEISSIDRDYMKIPEALMLDHGINIIEDMHGLDRASHNYQDLKMYSLVLYLKPSEVQHLKMIGERGKIWQESSGRKVDLTNSENAPNDNQFIKFMQSTKSQSRAYHSRERIMQEDAPALENLRQRIPVIEVDPTAIVNLTYQK